MPANYDTISKEDFARYGWDIERIGKMLLSDRYADRTHFVFESDPGPRPQSGPVHVRRRLEGSRRADPCCTVTDFAC